MPKPGQVVRLRISPIDCLSILDVLDAAGVPRKNISFSSCSSLALATLLETVKKANLIPTPDGFDFAERMEPYIGWNHKGRRKGAADTLFQKAGELPFSIPQGEEMEMPLEQAIEICENFQAMKTQGVQPTEKEIKEYEQAMKVVYRE